MQCQNCGAPMEETALLCPYCGFENEAEALRQQEADLSGIYGKIAALFHLPQRAAKKAVRWIVTLGIGLLLLFLLLLLFVFGGSRLVTGTALSRQNARLEKLEALYSAGDYGAMCALLDKTERAYADTYGKYTSVGEVFSRLEDLKESSQESARFVAGYPEGYDLLRYELEWGLELLALCRTQEEAGFVYGQGPEIKALEQQVMALLQDTLLLTEEEIAEGFSLYQSEGDLLPLCKTSAQRLSEDPA
ncbi:MAG: zinc ribbon domain-containing protein [Clostridia bacterium]|nr:zinc ribbon domain-containing protein [Clostridia bacterium]